MLWAARPSELFEAEVRDFKSDRAFESDNQHSRFNRIRKTAAYLIDRGKYLSHGYDLLND